MPKSTSLEKTQDPKERMKTIRAFVKTGLKNKVRLDQFAAGFDIKDIFRVIVALQDEVEKSQTKHKAATDHIAEMIVYGEDQFKAYAKSVTTITNELVDLESQNAGYERMTDEMLDEYQALKTERDDAVTLLKAYKTIQKLEGKLNG
jgi:uncharacterized protein (UPF0305 family)